MTSQAETQPAAPVAAAIPFPSPSKPLIPSLLGPRIDVFMVGGLSLLVYAVLVTFFDTNSKNDMTATVAAQLALIVNNPHFMASYGLLYWDQRKRLLENWRMILAAFVVPVLIIAYYIYAFTQKSPVLFGYAVNTMYFFVGWHYIKQIYGVLMVAGARKGYYYDDKEKFLLRWMLFPLWMVSYLNGNQSVTKQNFYGIDYLTFYLPQWAVRANMAFVGVVTVGFVAIFARKWIKTGRLPDLVSLAALTSIYVWHLPQSFHGLMWYLIPFFHSLQYLLFVSTYKHNEFAQGAVTQEDTPDKRRYYYLTQLILYIGIMVFTAYLFFDGIPNAFDKALPYDHTVLGTSLFSFMFINFINIHHYFIDSAIWKRDNPNLAKYLVRPSAADLA